MVVNLALLATWHTIVVSSESQIQCSDGKNARGVICMAVHGRFVVLSNRVAIEW